MNDHPTAGLVELVTSDIPSTGSPWWHAGLVWLVVLLVLMAAIAAVRRVNARDPAATAFARLSRALGLSRQERRELQRLAAQAGTPPVALLLSPHALRAAAKEEDEQPGIRALVLKLGNGY